MEITTLELKETIIEAINNTNAPLEQAISALILAQNELTEELQYSDLPETEESEEDTPENDEDDPLWPTS